MTNVNPIDHLKYLAVESKSQLDYVIDRLCQANAEYPLTEDEHEVLLSMLEGLQRTVTESAATFCHGSEDFGRYSDGRPVRTHLEIEDGVIFEHRWHPQPDHPRNMPHEIYTARGRDTRRRHTVLVAAPGVLDCVAAGPNLTVVR